jgi:hypothetical protein
MEIGYHQRMQGSYKEAKKGNRLGFSLSLKKQANG